MYPLHPEKLVGVQDVLARVNRKQAVKRTVRRATQPGVPAPPDPWSIQRGGTSLIERLAQAQFAQRNGSQL